MFVKILKILAIALLLLIPLYTSAHGLNAEEVYRVAHNSVYTIYTLEKGDERYEAVGSAVAVTENILATNCHVAPLGEFLVKVDGGFKKGFLSFQDKRHDLCLLKINDIKLRPVEMRDSSSVNIGEDAFAIGSPNGLEKSISRGIISNKYKFRHGSVLQTDATISVGSSGGGLFDDQGKLIGITRAGHRYKDIAFTIPTEWIEVVLSGKKPEWLPDKKIILQELGVFGKNKISLYRYDGNCFLFFRGQSLDEDDQGSMVWFPQQESKIYFLPLTTDVKDAVLIMMEEGIDFEHKGDIFFKAKPEFQPIVQPTELVVKNLDYNPIQRFQSGKDITMYYSDVYHQRANVSINFGLMGFSKALQFYYKLCQKPEDVP